ALPIFTSSTSSSCSCGAASKRPCRGAVRRLQLLSRRPWRQRRMCWLWISTRAARRQKIPPPLTAAAMPPPDQRSSNSTHKKTDGRHRRFFYRLNSLDDDFLLQTEAHGVGAVQSHVGTVHDRAVRRRHAQHITAGFHAGGIEAPWIARERQRIRCTRAGAGYASRRRVHVRIYRQAV